MKQIKTIYEPRGMYLQATTHLAMGLLLLLSSRLLLAQTNRSVTNAVAPVATSDSTRVNVGTFSIQTPLTWKISTGTEAEQLKSQIKQGIDQMISQYRSDTGMDSRLLGIQDFKVVQLSDAGGWCVIHSMRIPPITDYYETMKEDTRQKIEWGLSRGIFEKVIENGPVSIGTNTVMKSIFQQKGGGRLIQMAHWSPKEPSQVSQIMILQNSGGAKLSGEVDACVKSVLVMQAVK